MAETASVAVAVATLWTAPDRIRDIDGPMLSVPGSCRAWVSAIPDGTDAGLGDRVESQLLLGDRVVIQDVRDRWARVLVPGQPAQCRDPVGYPGWMPVEQLTAGEHRRDGDGEFVTSALTTALYAAPSGAVAVPDVVLGTRLNALGDPADGWLPVSVVGRPEALWVPAGDVRPADGESGVAPDSASLLATAMRLVGTPYVWGGLTPFGIDCSGLTHLAHRLAGVEVPRNASDQQTVAQPVPLGEEIPGDLYFFAREGGRAHHVGFAAGDGWMVDACSTARRVEHHPLSAQRRETLVGCGRLLPARRV
ncbi:C40 family peptidase [Rugosimonospora africana]|uniref:Peptidase P60 n=1 Tax=Rugosimonospora africana TaxID=556532 RepID=A0A8J3QRZ9_9ACTN|nr:NlpC/P60 family protein [Rugosimonospora africana]GIH15574.1 peptidase P60 [Rugosimonospora africana]